MKVLLVDDHPLILSALQGVIRGLGNDVSVTCAASARELRQRLAEDADYDLLLLDLQLGDADGFEVLTEMRRDHPALPVVVVSGTDRAPDVLRAIDLGAMGFVPKRASNELLFEALRLVMSGGIFVPPVPTGLGSGLPPAAQEPPPPPLLQPRMQPAQGAASGLPVPNVAGLTPRQNEVLGKLLQGLPNKLIARELNLSVETVKDHVAAVLRVLNVSTRTQAVLAVSRMAQQQGGSASAQRH
ncbi:response regulator [Azohydromonas caseinilytica]|uniref:Response regulator transcription factor n=1 Tax=Azohydromonas caseinilytica TaxID=2728836 RepID=A0A848F2W1_9BURK|nr:response regulator transcription factor [Azohydromonas caseinilytica]NML14004.1 response regulator transcription factor [Azohydromonas caseinilytica]